jgi:glycerophosphoryl diester phosphodiesterase
MKPKWICFVCVIAALLAMPVCGSEQISSKASVDMKGRHKMALLAHRGESYIAPENTLAAFKMAWDKGAKAVELDVYLTKDHKIVVVHDANTKRTGGADLVIKDTDSVELRKLDLGKLKGEQFAGEKIPFLDEVLAAMPKGGTIFCEIKCGVEILPFLQEVLDKSGKRSQVTIISFSLDVVSASKKMMPDCPTYYLRSPAKDPATGKLLAYDSKLIQAALDNHLDGLDLEHTLMTKEYVDAIKAAGLAIWTWTVDDVPEAKRQMELGVDGMATNRTAWMAEQLAK